ncbi:MAG: hypothetical protein KH415_11215 [Clostridium sp.]|nr:hypothetical protein [Clostridium sp.]
MNYIKDIFNLKENKKYKITILILIFIILILQTGNSISNKKIKLLNDRVKTLNSEITRINNSSSSEINLEDNLQNDVNIKNYDIEKNQIKEKYREFAEEKGKILNENITNGDKRLVDERLKLDISDKDIKRHIDSISKKEFNILIEENKILDDVFYKIYIIE